MSDLILLWCWNLIAVVGLGYTAWNLRDAHQDRVVLRDSGEDGVYEITADANVRREWTRLGFWLVALVIGILALLELGEDWLGWALVGVMALSAWNSRQDRRERVEVRHSREGATK